MLLLFPIFMGATSRTNSGTAFFLALGDTMENGFDSAELRAKQVQWQEWRNNLYGDMKYATRQAQTASRHSRSEKSIESAMSRAVEFEETYTLACELDAKIKTSRREEKWLEHAAALDEAAAFMARHGGVA
jgi:hypothetical protein